MPLKPDRLAALGANYAAAWSSLSPAAVAAFHAPDGSISVNHGAVRAGRQAIVDRATASYDELPELELRCDAIRNAGDHAVFLWTLEGAHAETGQCIRIEGWEEWRLNEAGQIAAVRGWFDAAEYERQVGEGVERSRMRRPMA